MEDEIGSAIEEKNSKGITATQRRTLCKVEKAGKEAMGVLFDMVKNSDLSYAAMAKVMDTKFPGFDITKSDVVYFFRTHTQALTTIIEEQKGLNKVRADLYMDSDGTMVKDIKVIDAEVQKLLGEDGYEIEPDKRAKAIANLLDTKGRLLLRRARLNGGLVDPSRTQIDKMEVNVYQQINNEKSDLIQRLRKVEFQDAKVIEVPAHENKKTNP
jgi:hypothetical protein